MANVDRPNGAVAIDSLTGSPVVGKMNPYTADGTVNDAAIFPGDFVTLTANGTVRVAVAAEVILGVCGGIEVAAPTVEDGFLSNNNIGVTEHPGYLPADTAGTVLVLDDPDQLFEIQSDGIITSVDQGNNAEIVPTAGSTVTGRSAMEVSATTIAGTAQLRLIRPIKRADNDITLTNGRWIVYINEHAYRTAAGI